MRHRIGLSILCLLPVLLLVTSCSPATGSSAAESLWAIQGSWTDSCCCKVSCPCFFGTKPTEGYCQGASLIEIEHGHHGDVKLDGTSLVVAYHVGQWTRIYVGEGATEEQARAVAAVLPKALPFLGKGPIESVETVPLIVERSGDRVKYSVAATTVELALVEGADGQPIRLENLPAKGAPFPKLRDHTQYKSIHLDHDSGDHKFSWSGRNGFSSKLDLSGS